MQRFQKKFATLNYASGQVAQAQLPSDDYTTAVELISAQTVTTGVTPPTIAGWGAWGPLQQITVTAPGNRRPFALPGYHADLAYRLRDHAWHSSMTATPNVASTTNAWVNHVRCPLTITNDTELGAFYTGDDSLDMFVQVACGTAAQAFTAVSGATIAGSWDAYREYFSAPAPDQPGGWLDAISYYRSHTVQFSGILLNAGPISLPRLQDYMRLICVLYTGNNYDSTFAPADGLYTSATLTVNSRINIVDGWSEAKVKFEQERVYKFALPAGSFVLDFNEILSSRRDILPTDAISSLQLTFATANGSAKADVICETVVDSPFAAKYAAAAAKGKAA